MSDFLQGCMEEPKTTLTVAEFGEVFCKRCRNAECERAQGLNDRFRARVSTQADRLLNPKHVVTQASGSKYERLKDFVDMTHQAVRLEIADRRQDWTLPEEPPSKFVAAEESKNPAALPEPVPEPPSPKTPDGPPPPTPLVKNTPLPPNGFMIDGGQVPSSPTIRPQPIPADSWEAKPVITKVKPGSRVKMGGGQ